MTVLELLTSMLLKINVIDEVNPPSAEQGQRALQAINLLMAQWELDGIDIAWYPQSDMTATVPVADGNLRTLIFCGARELAAEFGVSAGDPMDAGSVASIAQDSYARLTKAALPYFEADMTMLPQASGSPWMWGFGPLGPIP